ncbi:MAG: cupin domain-containing protein [Ectothiorhodospiraceae bacterium]|nr:cupin domain-containing protein [Ectothiorhodospiraceae bacterium]
MSRRDYSIVAGAMLLAASVMATTAQADTYRGDGHLMITPDALEWGPVASMAEPARIAVIEGDLSQEEPFTFRLKLPAGYRIEPHHHPAYERVTVISGELHFAHGSEFDADATRTLPPGGVAIMPPGAPMFGYAETDTVIQLHGVGPWGIEYVNPEDDPRR